MTRGVIIKGKFGLAQTDVSQDAGSRFQVMVTLRENSLYLKIRANLLFGPECCFYQFEKPTR